MPIWISIHALREEGDIANSKAQAVTDVFQSTPSARRATGTKVYIGVAEDISIHALREEGDAENAARIKPKGEISIHALREEGDRTCRATTAALN